jgi:large subunit ribosomal protein L13
MRERTAAQMLEEKPEELVKLAVKGMLPKNRLSRKLVTKLKVYAGAEHPHEAQKPQPLAV